MWLASHHLGWNAKNAWRSPVCVDIELGQGLFPDPHCTEVLLMSAPLGLADLGAALKRCNGRLEVRQQVSTVDPSTSWFS